MSVETVSQATLTLFGGTGDLAARKLLPALFELWRKGRLADCLIVGVGRSVKSTAEYLAMLKEKVELAASQPGAWETFAKQIVFHHGNIETLADFQSLRATIERSESERKAKGNRLFYYAVGPKWFTPITARLSESGLLTPQPPGSDGPWTRLVIEKPFGHDLASAIALDDELHRYADERQIFRIDHYLGKETVQNMLAFRFANGLFEPVWNHKYITSVQITVAETLGVGGRGGYYEEAGAFRDMVENHMLQLLAMTAMEPPISLDAEDIRDEKLKVFRALRVPKSPEEVAATTYRGQYGPGKIAGADVPGYRQEKDVNPQSATLTYLAAKLYLDNWRWANVPFYLRHGKRLAKRGTEIAIQFNTPPLALFHGTNICGSIKNLLVLRIQPNEGVSLSFGVKKPGAGMEIANAELHFEYQNEFHQQIPEAYERLLLDALLGDPTLFTRSDEVRAMWRWADALMSGWDKLPTPNYPNYTAGSWGPHEAEELFPQGEDAPAGVCQIGWRRW